METIIPFLIVFPIVIAVLMFCIRNNKARGWVAYIGATAEIAAVGVLVAKWIEQGMKPVDLFVETEMVDHVILGVEVLVMLVVTFLSFKYRKVWVSLLSIIPTISLVYLELAGPEMEELTHIHIDHLAILMCLIVGVIGGLIIVYSVGYMHGYHQHHTEVQDRRYYFFMVLFLFLGSMFGFVLSSNLLWIDLFWELTSVCSFLLIGYTRSEEAINNSFRALWMNLTGGVALAIGIIYFAYNAGTVDLYALVEKGVAGDVVAVLPVALIAFAAMTKAAQLPFSSWLVGAMVAPTPSSALLHSATMVKAGIYVMFRLSPAMAGTTTGFMLTFVGGFTFLAASIIAIAQSDGKKVLAFSTISNLGLMTACAGIGTAETIWAGVFLMIFHAISKSLLFQDVGATENTLHSRDVEDMQGLLYRLPTLAIYMFIGIAGMFLAPFGMLISKWAALKASIDSSNIWMILFICFGSATTSFYWTKWMGKIIAHRYADEEPVKDKTKANELVSLTIHAVLMIVVCVVFPLISKYFVSDLLVETFGVTAQTLPTTVLYILVVIICLVFAVPFIAHLYSEKAKTEIKLSYMNGINEGNNATFTDSFGGVKDLQVSNYYFASKLGQRKLMVPVQVAMLAFILVCLGIIVGGVM